MHSHKTKAFTLVELIVVITILAILATIAFLSFQNISSTARDSSKLSDITNIKKTLELTNATNGNLPLPDGPTQITWSGTTVWYQGILGDTVIKQIKKLSKKPLDPLTNTAYTYSVTSNQKEYQIGYALENPVSYNNKTKETYADINSLLGYADGNYNGVMIKVNTGSTDYYLGVPSIITSDTSKTNLINQTGSLVFNGKKCLASSYTGTMTNTCSTFNPKNTGDFLIYSGTITTDTDKTNFLTNLKNVYTGSILTTTNDTNLTNRINGIGNTNTLVAVLNKVGTSVSMSNNSINSSKLGVVDFFGDNSGKALYQFENNVNDTSSSYTGTWGGTPGYATGKYGTGASFNGNSYISISTALYSNSLSISLWVNQSSIDYYLGNYRSCYISATDLGSNYFSIGAFGSSPYYFSNITGGVQIISSSIAQINIWNNLVLTYASGVSKLYLNGVLIGSSGGSNFTPSSFLIGSETTTYNRYSTIGTIDQVRIFNKALSQSEVTQLYNEQ